MWIWGVLLLFVFPSITQAAYVDAQVVSNELQVDGRVLIVLNIRGDAGEDGVQLKYYVPSNPTLAGLRNTIADKIQELNFIRTVASAPSVRSGQVLTPLARVAPAPTAKQIWREKTVRLDRYLELQAKGIAAISPAVTDLLADLNATYQAGYAD